MKSRLSKSSFNIRNNGQLISYENSHENSYENGHDKYDDKLDGKSGLFSPGRGESKTPLRDQNEPSFNSSSQFSSPFFRSPLGDHSDRPHYDRNYEKNYDKNYEKNYEKNYDKHFDKSDGKSFESRLFDKHHGRLSDKPRTPLSDFKVRFNQSTLDIHDELSPAGKQLNKQNSKSIASLHSNLIGAKCLSTPSAKAGRQVTKRKNSVNISKILLDKLTNSTSKSNSSIDRASRAAHQSLGNYSLKHLSSNSINKSHNHLSASASQFQETPSDNIEDFFEFAPSNPLANEGIHTPIVNNPQLELKLSQIRKAKQSSQSIFDLRRNQHQFESNHSNLSFGSTATSSTTAVNSIATTSSCLRITGHPHASHPTSHQSNHHSSISEVDSACSPAHLQSAAKKSFQRVAKLKTQNANRFKELINSKKFSQSLNDLTDLSMINAADGELNWKEFGDAYQNEISERRYVHHITEIEMDNAVLQTGATLRFVCSQTFSCFQDFPYRLSLSLSLFAGHGHTAVCTVLALC